jgi:hypothetical protein
LRGKPEKFKLDCGHIISGLEMAIKSMKKKEISHFLISSDYAFGDLGCPDRYFFKRKKVSLTEPCKIDPPCNPESQIINETSLHGIRPQHIFLKESKQ